MRPSPTQTKRMQSRLARVEGQLRGIQRLIGEEEDCEKIIQQLLASRKALDKAYFELLACMVEACVQEVDDPKLSQRVDTLRNLLTKYN